MINKYVKKPVVVEAIQYTKENISSVLKWFEQNNSSREIKYNHDDNNYYIVTLEGDMKLSVGDYIIKGIKGEFYPCKPDIFKATYEEVKNE